MEALSTDPELNHATGEWRRKHPPEMVKIDGRTEFVYIWIDKEQEEDFSATCENILTIMDEMPDESNTRTLFAMIQAFLTSTARSP